MYTLSFAIVTRNRPESLSKTLYSLSLQNLQPFEIIISDDSNDPISVEANKELAEVYNCVYVSGPQKGLYANRNFVARKAKGTHYRSVDDDHEFPDGHIEVCMQAIQKEPDTVWTIGEYNHTFKPEERVLPSPIAGELHPRGFSYIPETFENYYGISCGATIYPKSLIDRNLLNSENYRFGILFLEYGARLHFNKVRIQPLTDTFVIHNDVRLNTIADPPALIKEIRSAKLFSMFLLSFHYQRTLKNRLLTTLQIASDLLKKKYARQLVRNAYEEYRKTIKTNSLTGL